MSPVSLRKAPSCIQQKGALRWFKVGFFVVYL